MGDFEEKIRSKAYEIWERDGRTGDPQDHWLEAEREIKAGTTGSDTAEAPSEAPVAEAPPVEAVKAAEAIDNAPRNRRSRSKS